MRKLVDKTCPKCSKSFSCKPECWCGDFPIIIPMNPNEECLCRDCLKANILNKINEWMNPLTLRNSKKIKALGKPEALIEDIDYTLNKKDQMVLSGWFLMRKGTCCGNGCTNCPYDKIVK